jgi:CRP/FNR family cyclic AMP-dependent transcriptional regulator
MVKNIRILDRQFVPAGTLVLEQGEIGSRAYMIESGGVEVFMRDEDGKELILSRLGAGSMVGEMAAMGDGKRSASARTSEDSVLITISAHDLHASMKASDGLYKRLMHMMVSRMRDTNMKLLKKEQELGDVEKAARKNLEDVASHLSSRRNILEKEVAPLFMKADAEKQRSLDSQKDQ